MAMAPPAAMRGFTPNTSISRKPPNIYLLLGLVLPFYAGFNAGISPTFGFVISFVVISPAIYFLNKIPKIYPPLRMFIACFVGLLICYAIGSVFMMFYLKWEFVPTLTVSVVPYIPFDIAKIVVTILVVMLLPENIKNPKSKEEKKTAE